MNQCHFIQSSVSKKIVMAITGIFLMSFLSLHLSVNLFLFCGEKSFNEAVAFMRRNMIVRILEYVLALGFIIHIFFGIRLHLKNRKTKGREDYAVQQSVSSFGSRTMIYTGFLILCFLILHLMNFMIPMKYHHENSDYNIVVSLFKNPIYTFVYVFSFFILGIHLSHGFQSSFQSLGLSTNKRRLYWIQKLGCFYFWLICSGFSIIAIWFFFIQ
ncbi:succinate dehydrogenase cytochrome b subunit [Blattabacterium cuenoti]|uniref:succinate dehydrogenase cytochrome b subunit n=1 Tax=Blattabacterium cuenoti TaxID=1653831 RepID=UPI00163B6985|nr:succinate dehydrogenase cytochrome b subunit [Blattabacterium cuenoti]